MKFDRFRFVLALPLLAAVFAVAALVFWWARQGEDSLSERLPGADQPPGAEGAAAINPILAGKLIPGPAQQTNLPGLWPQFRGPNRDDISPETTPLARSWDPAGPRQLWAVDCGEGYAGVVVREGRVYLLDYDYDKKQNALRCLSLADGAELWRYAYNLPVKRNHGMTRTVPALSDKFIVAMDPKCHVLCLDAATGELRWGMNLVSEFGATVPPWYAGQCPLIDSNAVILAPGGHDALLAAVELETGKILWRAPNPRGWKMTHSSVMPMEFAGQRFYVYCGSGGVAGVSATNGALLWDTDAWKISIATVPSPLVLEGGKILLAGGYNSGSLLLQLKDQGGKLVPETVWKLAPEVFAATQQTPIFHNGNVFGTRPDGRFVCLGLDGKVLWASPAGDSFGLGPFLFADGLFFVMNDSGRLTLVEDSSSRFTPLAQAQVLQGRESWGPMALVGGRLLARDLTRLVCLDVSAGSQTK
ncbi:MAG: PQQ-binding-like beta-propeller repeat protein [Verrucomicrobiota bacterium]|jgi:outer membrane protein assembly factor BamB